MKVNKHSIMQNTIGEDTLRECVMRNEVVLAKDDKGIIKKGDTFVQYKPRHTMIFMKVNNVEHTESMDLCTVTWYMLDAKGLNVQSRFPMAALNGVFLDFNSISCDVHKKALAIMRECDAKIKDSHSADEKKSLAQKCRRKLVKLIKM